MKMREIWKQKDLAEKLGVSEEKLIEWRKLGMPFVKLGQEVFIIESSFIAWVQGQEKGKNGKTPDSPQDESLFPR